MKTQERVNVNNQIASIAVAFLARGADKDWRASCKRFITSYSNNRPGIEHSLYVIFKGFPDDLALEDAKNLFQTVPHTAVFLNDNSFDIGAYIEWANQIDEETICVFNTHSEILAEYWLLKLAVNLALPNVGLVGASASYESLNELSRIFPKFPNIHIRSNAFMINRKFFCRITESVIIAGKIEAYLIESGPKNMTKQILASGQEILLVGRNGRGYSPRYWPTSNTFRLGRQSNLLIADKQTRTFNELPWHEKRKIVLMSWGQYIREEKLLSDRTIHKSRVLKNK